MSEILTNSIFLIAITIVIGKLVGKFSVKGFSLGSSAILFVGIIFIEILFNLGYTDIEIPSVLFNISLNSFVTVVALIASSSLVSVFKKHGVKFILLGFSVRASAALVIFIFMTIFPNLLYQLTGVFVGAVTSSPGFGNALELASKPVDMSAFVTIGYVISYLPGVISVIMFGRISANRYKKKHPDLYSIEAFGNGDLSLKKNEFTGANGFDIVKFMIVYATGLLIGSVTLSFGEGMVFSLGGTGGCLFSALIFGAFVKGFSFDESKLNVIKEISICSFLAIIGLRYGHRAFESLLGDGLIIFPMAITVSITAISSGLLVGKYILKIETPLLSGGICGAMTSTPGLAATLEAFEDSSVVTGYGATYPFGLIFAILFINLFI